MAGKEALFGKYDLAQVLDGQRQRGKEAAEAVPIAALGSDLETIAIRITEELSIPRIELRGDEVTVETAETQVDVSGDHNRAIFDRSRPFYLEGINIRYCVPFSGDQRLFFCQPNSYTLNPPRARVESRELVFEYDVVGTDVASTKAHFQRDLGTVQQYVGWVNEMVDAYNQQVPSLVRQSLSARLSRVHETEKQIGELGFQVRQTASASAPTSPGVSEVKAKTRGGRSRGPPVEYDVALSFAGENREYVEQVATLLKERSVAVFYDRFEETSLWGENLVDRFAEVYGSKSRFVVLFVSEHYAVKAWPTLERQHAQAKAMKSAHAVVLPARFDDTEIPGLPDTVGYLDLRRLSPEEVVDRVIQKLVTERNRVLHRNK